MKKYCVFMAGILFFIVACSSGESDSLPLLIGSDPAAAETDTGSTVDYGKYKDADVAAYDSFESVPPELKNDVSAKALNFVTAAEKFKENGQGSSNIYSSLMSVYCLMYNCWKPMVSCVIDKECRSQLMSIGNCVYKGGDEMMLCFIAGFSRPDEKLLEMMSCLGGGGCLPDPVPNCAVPTNRDGIAPVTLADLEGDWYVVRGLSPVYDCFSGQRYSFSQVSDTVSTYRYTYFPVDKESPVDIQCTTTVIPFATGETEIYPGRFRVNYTAYGMPGIDDWYCLSHPNSKYLLIYYCGASAMDSYVGGIVLSRTLDTSIPQNILDDFAGALAGAGISDPVYMADFCIPDNTGISY